MMSVRPSLSAQDFSVLKRACRGNGVPASLIEVIFFSDSAAKRRQAVQDIFLRVDGEAASFAHSLAKGIRRLRIVEGDTASDRAGSNRVLRAAGLCISKILDMDVSEADATEIHRGLRQPALLLALTEVVRDNDTGSGAQRAAASALVTFCERLPALWKELAKEIQGDSTLLKGFLAQAASLQSITDHRTQELAFESVFRMWKVWKKQAGGPPALPLGTHDEVKVGISSIAAKDFDGGVREMLDELNNNRRRKEGNEWDGAPSSSFAVQAVSQLTDWTGIGCERGIGKVEWLDVGGDSISMKVRQIDWLEEKISVCCGAEGAEGREVYQTATGDRGAQLPAAVFLSIPAEVVAVSARHLVSTWSLRIEVAFADCPALARVAEKPPCGRQECILTIRLKDGGRDFAHLRKAITRLSQHASNPSNDRSTIPKTSMASSTRDKMTSPDIAARKNPPGDNLAAVPAVPRKQSRNVSGVQKASRKIKPTGATSEGRFRREEQSSRKRKQPMTTESDIATSPAISNPGLGGDNSAKKAVKSTRLIVEGGNDEGCSFREANEVEDMVGEEEAEDSWMEPQRQLDLVPVSTVKSKDLSSSHGAAASMICSTIGATTTSSTTIDQTPTNARRKRFKNASSSSSNNINNNEPLVVATPTPPLSQRPPRRAAAASGLKAMSSGSFSDEEARESSQDNDCMSTYTSSDKADSDGAGSDGTGSDEACSVHSGREEDRGEITGVEEPQNNQEQRSHFSFSAEEEEDQVTVPIGKERSSGRSRAPERVPGGTLGAKNRRVCRGVNQGQGTGRGTNKARSEELQELNIQETCPAWNEELSDPRVRAASNHYNNSDSNDQVMQGQTNGSGTKGRRGVDTPEEEEADEATKENCKYVEEDIDEEEEGGAEWGNDDVEEEDSAILTQLFNQFVATAQARDQRTKKANTDAAVEETRQECRVFLESTAKVLTDHWRRQADELREQARQAEEGIVAARETIWELTREHEDQWQACRDRIQKHQATLKLVDAELSSGPGAASASKLERGWKGDAEALRLQLQKHREGAVSRFASTFLGSDKKKKGQQKGYGRGGGGGSSNGGSEGGKCKNQGGAGGGLFPGDLLSHLKMRTM